MPKIRPLVIKSYLSGDHPSLCEDCICRDNCRKYKRSNRVFYCSKWYERYLAMNRPGKENGLESDRIVIEAKNF